LLVFLNIPPAAPNGTPGPGEAFPESFISPNAGLALFCSFALGFGDACYNTQTISLLGGVYPDRYL
jgi:hypothetical protein